MFLVRNDTSLEQVRTLLALFEADIDSMPAEVETPQKVKRSVYKTSMEYSIAEEGPHLRVVFSPEVAMLVHEGSAPLEMRPWTYDGPVALRGNFHRSSL